MPIAMSEQTCKDSVENLNQLLADTMTLRDLYKKHHWQIAGPEARCRCYAQVNARRSACIDARI